MKIGELKKANCVITLNLDETIGLIEVIKSQGVKIISHFEILPKELESRLAVWRDDNFIGMVRTRNITK